MLGGYGTLTAMDKAAQLDVLYRTNEKRTRRALNVGAAKFVRGDGSVNARVMFIGEAPGLNEDREGKPFVGRAGKLLTQFIELAGLKREDVFISNTVKYHPMKNPATPDVRGNDRPPTPQEIEVCRPILKEEIAIIQPEVIVTLGTHATQTVLATKEKITALRGKLIPWDSVRVMPTFHPAALCHNPPLRKDVEADMQLLKKTLEMG